MKNNMIVVIKLVSLTSSSVFATNIRNETNIGRIVIIGRIYIGYYGKISATCITEETKMKVPKLSGKNVFQPSLIN